MARGNKAAYEGEVFHYCTTGQFQERLEGLICAIIAAITGTFIFLPKLISLF